MERKKESALFGWKEWTAGPKRSDGVPQKKAPGNSAGLGWEQRLRERGAGQSYGELTEPRGKRANN